jgi:lysophospholipid acyltransferase (LPLAT)-like uncharacterized protein
MAAAKNIKYYLLNICLTALIYHSLNLYWKTLRVQFEGIEIIRHYLESGGRVVMASWHQRFFGGFYLPRIFEWSPCIMISMSRDGDFVSGIARRIGWIPVRGSSSRGGKTALREMIQGIIENRIGGHIVDGPQGPPRVIKPGLISLAQKSGAAICPGFISYEKAWIFNSWDRFMIPKPFSRVLFRTGSLCLAPENMDEDRLEVFRRDLEEKMIVGYEAADSYWKKSVTESARADSH